MAFGIILQQSGKDEFGVLPQHLHGGILCIGVDQVASFIHRSHCGAKAVDQFGFHQGLMKVAFDPEDQRALLPALIRIGGDQYRRDWMPTFDQMVIKLEARHIWHVKIGDQASGGGEFRRRKKMRRRRKHRDRIIRRLEKLAHGVAEGLIVIDERALGQCGLPMGVGSCCTAAVGRPGSSIR
jgi:hypothetical protein